MLLSTFVYVYHTSTMMRFSDKWSLLLGSGGGNLLSTWYRNILTTIVSCGFYRIGWYRTPLQFVVLHNCVMHRWPMYVHREGQGCYQGQRNDIYMYTWHVRKSDSAYIIVHTEPTYDSYYIYVICVGGDKITQISDRPRGLVFCRWWYHITIIGGTVLNGYLIWLQYSPSWRKGARVYSMIVTRSI